MIKKHSILIKDFKRMLKNELSIKNGLTTGNFRNLCYAKLHIFFL